MSSERAYTTEGTDTEADCTDVLLCGSKGQSRWEAVEKQGGDWRKEEILVQCDPGTGTHTYVETKQRNSYSCCLGVLFWVVLLAAIAAVAWVFRATITGWIMGDHWSPPITKSRYEELQGQAFTTRTTAWQAMAQNSGVGRIDKSEFVGLVDSTTGEVGEVAYPSLRAGPFRAFVQSLIEVEDGASGAVVQPNLQAEAATAFNMLDSDGDLHFTMVMTYNSFRAFCRTNIEQMNETMITYAYNGMDVRLHPDNVTSAPPNRDITFVDFEHFFNEGPDFYWGDRDFQMTMARLAAEAHSATS